MNIYDGEGYIKIFSPIKMIHEYFFKGNKSSNLALFLCVNCFFFYYENRCIWILAKRMTKVKLLKPNSYKKQFKNTSIP